MTTTLSAFALLLIAGAYIVNVLRGTGRAWLRAKWLGEPQAVTG